MNPALDLFGHLQQLFMVLKSLHIHAEGLPKCNPCPCGFYGDVKRECCCSPRQIENNRQRISGPLLDRINLHVEVPLVDFRELSSGAPGEKSAVIRERVIQARSIQLERSANPRTAPTPPWVRAR